MQLGMCCDHADTACPAPYHAARRLWNCQQDNSYNSYCRLVQSAYWHGPGCTLPVVLMCRVPPVQSHVASRPWEGGQPWGTHGEIVVEADGSWLRVPHSLQASALWRRLGM